MSSVSPCCPSPPAQLEEAFCKVCVLWVQQGRPTRAQTDPGCCLLAVAEWGVFWGSDAVEPYPSTRYLQVELFLTAGAAGLCLLGCSLLFLPQLDVLLCFLGRGTGRAR